MKLLDVPPISPKAAIVAIGVLVPIVVNHELFFSTGPDLAAPVASETVVAQDTRVDQPVPLRSPLERLKDSAEAGNIADQLTLAIKFSAREVNDQIQAAHWYLRAAQGGNVEAMHEVSMRYMHGYGLTKNHAEANVWRQRAASAGHPEAAYAMAQTYGTVTGGGGVISQHKDKDPGESSRQLVVWLTRASEAGSAAATHELALVRLYGVSKEGAAKTRYLMPLPAVTASAVQLLKQNAEAGFWKSQHALAELYQVGYADIKPDLIESNKWWHRLDAQTDPTVQAHIGEHYRASDANQYRAGDNKWMGKNLSYHDTNRLALEWFSRAAAQGNSEALWQLAVMEYRGIGTAKNPATALQLHRKAADLGQVDAMYQLGTAYITGNAVERDYVSALHWLARSAAYEGAYGDNPVRLHAQNALGALYENGYGVTRDAVLAYAWYHLASTVGSEDARKNLHRVESLLNPDQVREAQKLSRDWKLGHQITGAAR